MTKLHPAPAAVIHMVKCSCVKERCLTNRCQRRKADLRCTDICSCNDDGDDPCHNSAGVNENNESSDEEEEMDDEDESDV